MIKALVVVSSIEPLLTKMISIFLQVCANKLLTHFSSVSAALYMGTIIETNGVTRFNSTSTIPCSMRQPQMFFSTSIDLNLNTPRHIKRCHHHFTAYCEHFGQIIARKATSFFISIPSFGFFQSALLIYQSHFLLCNF